MLPNRTKVVCTPARPPLGKDTDTTIVRKMCYSAKGLNSHHLYIYTSSAGVPLSHFKDLVNSKKPFEFICLLYTRNTHQAVGCQSALKAEQMPHTIHGVVILLPLH